MYGKGGDIDYLNFLGGSMYVWEGVCMYGRERGREKERERGQSREGKREKKRK